MALHNRHPSSSAAMLHHAMLPELPDKRLHDFRSFLWLAWSHLNLPEPTPVQYDIAEYLQYGPRRKIIEGFRGVGKSWITSAYVVWRLRLDPQLNFLVVSASKVRADDFSTFTQMLINDMPLLMCLRSQPGQRNSKIAFDVATAEADHAPSVKSVGVFGQLAGSRADEIIADDVEIPNNSMTQQMRDRLSEAVKEFDAIVKPGGRITYLGTPQTEQSLYNALCDRGYAIRVWPARFPESREAASQKYGDRLAPRLQDALDKDLSSEEALSFASQVAGKATDPRRFGDLELMEREASYGKSGFALQFMLDTSISDADRHPLKLRDLIVMGVDPETAPEKVVWAGSDPTKLLHDLPCVGLSGDRYYAPMRVSETWRPYTGSCMVIDPSGRGRDETAYAVGKLLNSQIFIMEASGLSSSECGYDEAALTQLVSIAKRYKVNKVIIESNFGDGMFKALIEPYFVKEHPVSIEEVRHNIQKERRIIDTLEPVMNQHRLIIDRGVIERDFDGARRLIGHRDPSETLQYQLFYQMSHITAERGSLAHDDRLDALAMLVAYFTKEMNRDVDASIALHKEQALREELKLFYSNGRVSGCRWFQQQSVGGVGGGSEAVSSTNNSNRPATAVVLGSPSQSREAAHKRGNSIRKGVTRHGWLR